jgi:hypothetical protein
MIFKCNARKTYLEAFQVVALVAYQYFVLFQAGPGVSFLEVLDGVSERWAQEVLLEVHRQV